MPLYVVQVGGRESDVGLIFALTSLGSLPVRLLSGVILERFGPKHILVVGALYFLAAVIAYRWATSVPMVGVLRVVQGLGYGAFTGAGTALAAELIPASRRGEGMGSYSAGASIAQVGGPALGLAIHARYGFDILFPVAMAGALAAFGFSLLTRDQGRHSGAPGTGSGTGQQLFTVQKVRAREALLPSLLMLSLFGSFGVIIAYVPLQAPRAGFADAGLFFSVAALSMVVVRTGFSWLSDRLGRKVMILPGVGPVLLGLRVQASQPAGTAFLVAGALVGTGLGAAQPAILGFAIDRSPVERQAAAMSTLLLATDIGNAGFSALLGKMAPSGESTALYLMSGLA